MIKLENINKTYYLGKNEVKALKNISLEVEDSAYISIVGPSGSGKSTLLNIIGLLDKPTSGKIFIDDIDCSSFKEKQLCEYRKTKLGFIFQSFNLIPVFNVYENIETSFLISGSKINAALRKEEILKIIELVGLSDCIKHLPSELSGGQQQRVAIARALIKHPRYIIADEPTANLDTKTAFSIIELMQKMNSIENITFIFTTHDGRLLSSVNKKIYLIDGEIQ